MPGRSQRPAAAPVGGQQPQPQQPPPPPSPTLPPQHQQQQQHQPASNVVEVDDVDFGATSSSPWSAGWATRQQPPRLRPTTLAEAEAAGDAAAAGAGAASSHHHPHQQQQQQPQPPTNELDVGDVALPRGFDEDDDDTLQHGGGDTAAAADDAGPSSASAALPPQLGVLRALLPRPLGGGAGMPDFAAAAVGGGSGGGAAAAAGLDLVAHLNLDGIFLGRQRSVMHDAGAPTLLRVKEGDAAAAAAAAAQQQEQEQHKAARRQRRRPADEDEAGGDDGDAAAAASASRRVRRELAREARREAREQRRGAREQQPQQGPEGGAARPLLPLLPQLKTSPPRPHPAFLKPKHVKRHFMVPTGDGWKLHLVRTTVLGVPPTRHHPVILCPGLGSSGAYSFDLSPNVSLADYLATKGWDVWTCELRGNGLSDKPRLFSGRGRWWTIDDYVERDAPAVIRYVLNETHARQVHFLGHSMGGMILCGVLARVDTTTSKIRSCVAVGSGLFLQDSWWRLFDRGRFLLRAMWVVPAGALLRAYSRLMFGPWRVPYVDNLYFWPPNVDARVGRAMMARNFSDISVGVVRQIATAFGAQGLTTADGRVNYADPARLAQVSAPALFLVGDRDRMCPPDGCRRTWEMLGSPGKRFVCLGPDAGFGSHYGHFDILMGRRVENEVFPLIHGFLAEHDQPRARL